MMKPLLILSTFLILAVSNVYSRPHFNQVNSVQANGSVCPPIVKNDISCPVLCVAQQSQCPQQAKCPTGQQVCGDGTCGTAASCQGIANTCMCGHSASQLPEVLVPCAQTFTVNISHFDVANQQTQIQQICQQAYGLPLVVSWTQVLGGFPANGTPVWNVCDAPAGISLDYGQPMWISCFVIYFGFYIFLGLWILYKRFRERNAPVVSMDDSSSGYSGKDEKQISKHENLGFIVKGYNNDIFGTFMLAYVWIISLGWFVFLGFITGDYYGTYDVAFSLFGSSDLSEKVFCVIWFGATSWFLFINLTRSRIRNFFRIRGVTDTAKYVQIEKKREVVYLLDDHSPLLDNVRTVETTIRRNLGFDVLVFTSKIKISQQGRRYFEFQCLRYVLDPSTKRYEPWTIELGREHSQLLKLQHGLSTEEADVRLEMIGQNFIRVDVPSVPVAIWQELTGFFYLYQIQILWLFYYLDYWQIGISDTGVILLSAMIKVVIRLRSEYRVKLMAEHVDTCEVLRSGNFVKMSTANLVPGDIIKIQDKKVVPVDAIVLGGDVIVDESSLTGEPLPVRKFPIQDDSNTYDPLTSGKISTLFAGTTIVQTDSNGIALAVQTGTNSDKGRLIHKILFPNPVSFIFNEQLKFVFCLLLVWGFVLMGFGIWWLGGTGMAAWFYGMFCISQVMNPLLPAILVLGQSIASGTLRSKNIFCVDLPRILMAGKTQIFCFDKTGTLTREGLEFYGAQQIALNSESGSVVFEERSEKISELNSVFKIGLATCHSVTIVDNTYIGNPVDIEMFRATKWGLETKSHDYVDTLIPKDDPNRSSPVHVIKRFEFQHQRASMSVAVLDTETNHIHIFVKGSFERMKEISATNSVPSNFDRVATQLAREGCYVLGMAHRDLGEADIDQVKGWTRDQLESSVSFLGLILFKNMLKADTKDAILELKQGNTRVVMITGDSALTGIYIARASSMIPEGNRVILGDVVESRVVWTDVDTGTLVNDLDAVLAEKALKPVELALTGKALKQLYFEDRMRNLILDTRVFARCTPQDKILCVSLHMEQGITAMCGDGANDSGALRTAHVGLAMSEAEASIVSPFSTSERTVFSCVQLLIQGRAALATSFSGYKYLILYGTTMASLKLLTFYFSISLSENTWLWVDAACTVALSIAVTQGIAVDKLSLYRPTSRILGPETLTSVLGQVFINYWFLIGSFIWLFQQEWFRCKEFDARNIDPSKWWLLGDNFEGALLTVVTLFQFVNNALSVSFTSYKKWYRNWWIWILWTFFNIVTAYWLLADPNPFGCMFRMNCGDADVLVSLGYPRPTWSIDPYNIYFGNNVFPKDFRWKLFILCLANMICTNIFQFLVVFGPIRRYFRRTHPLRRKQLKL